MKQALVLLAAVAATAAITYLVVVHRQLGDQLSRVNQALAQAQERNDLLQAQLESARRRLLTEPAPAPSPAPTTPRPAKSNSRADLPGGPGAGISTHRETVIATEAVTVGAIPIPIPVAMPGITWARYDAQPGSEVRVAGTSSLQDWELNGNVIGGQLWLPAGLEANPRASVATWTNTVSCRASVLIPVRTLKSYSKQMDEAMESSLQAEQFPRIEYRLRGLRFDAHTTDAFATNGIQALVFMGTGDLVVHGVTKALQMPVIISLGPNGQLRVSGAAWLSMTDFGVQPPEMALAAGILKAANEAKVTFAWQLKRTGTLGTD